MDGKRIGGVSQTKKLTMICRKYGRKKKNVQIYRES